MYREMNAAAGHCENFSKRIASDHSVPDAHFNFQKMEK
jgi:hypothetical protein